MLHLKSHEKIHKNGETLKPVLHYQRSKVKCTVCDKEVFKSYLKEHIACVHNQEKNYSCEFCVKEFYDIGGRSLHVKSVHTTATSVISRINYHKP